MKKWIFITGFISLLFSLCAYEEEGVTEITEITYYTEETSISEVVSDPVFGDYGRLIFPVDTGYMSGNTLGDLGLAWYSNIRPELLRNLYELSSGLGKLQTAFISKLFFNYEFHRIDDDPLIISNHHSVHLLLLSCFLECER